MTAERTLFAHIASKLPHPENTAVDALGYILSSSPHTIRVLESVLEAGGAGVGEISKVRTQDSGEGGGRPDLAGFDKHGKKRVLIEAKFWAGLTENQPVAYLNQLQSDRPSALLFVAPAKRLETLWAELIRRVAESEELTRESDYKDASPLSIAFGKRRLMVASWETLLGRMASHASAAGDARAETDIGQLLGLTRRMDEDAFLPIRPEEFGPEFPRRILGLQRIIWAVTERGSAAKWLSTSDTKGRRMQASGNTDGYGQNVRIGRDNHAYAWLGYIFKDWARFRDTPMWLELGPQHGWRGGLKLDEIRRRLQPLEQEDPPGIIERKESGRLIVPIPLPVGVEEAAVVDSVVKRLEHVASLIDQHSGY